MPSNGCPLCDLFGDTVASVETASSFPLLRHEWRRAGLRATRKHGPTVVASDPAVRAPVATSANRRFLMKGDHDWDQVPWYDR